MDWSDYGARWYDAAIGRWGAVDPLAADYASWSPYNYVLGNPVMLTDPTGMAPENDYGLDVKTGEVTLLRETDDDTHTIFTGTMQNGVFELGEDGIAKSISFSTEVSNIEAIVDQFGDASYGGLVFSGGADAVTTGEQVMEFISMESHIELSAWAFDNNGGSEANGLYVQQWLGNDYNTSVDRVNPHSTEVHDVFYSDAYLGEKVYNVHTHPGKRNGDPQYGFGNPSTRDMQTTYYNKQYPHYIMSKFDGKTQYFPNDY